MKILYPLNVSKAFTKLRKGMGWGNQPQESVKGVFKKLGEEFCPGALY